MTGLFSPALKDYKRVEVVPDAGTYVQKPLTMAEVSDENDYYFPVPLEQRLLYTHTAKDGRVIEQQERVDPCPHGYIDMDHDTLVKRGCIHLEKGTKGTIIDHYKLKGLSYRVVELDKCPDGMVEEKATVANDCDKHGEEMPEQKQKPLLTRIKAAVKAAKAFVPHASLKKQQKKKGYADVLQEEKCGVREIILPCVINVPEVSFEHFKYVENDKPMKKEDYGTYILPMNFDTGIKKGLDGISLTNALLDIVSRGKFSVGVQCEHEKASIDGGFSTSETTRFGRRNWFQEKFFGLRFVYDRIFRSRTKGTAMQKAWTTMS